MNKKVYFAGSIRGGREDEQLYRSIIEYIKKTENEIRVVNQLCEGKSEKEKAYLLEILCNSCNYEILQWSDTYHNMTTWPLDDIYPAKFTTFED